MTDKLDNVQQMPTLLEFINIVSKGRFKFMHYNLLLIELLTYALAGKVSKLTVNLPQRHGKTLLFTQYFTAYYLLSNPTDNVILAGYSQGLSSDSSVLVKDYVNNYNYLSPYKPILREDSKGKNAFMFKHYNGQLKALSIHGAVLGFGANLMIIDDPIKNYKEAMSLVRQETLRVLYFTTLKTRLERRYDGKPPIFINISQRLNVNDLTGIIHANEPIMDVVDALKILRNGGTIPEETFVNVSIPAICEEETDFLGRKKGEPLFPEQRSIEWLLNEKKAMGSFLFNAVYQQNPSELEGDIFKRSWFKIINEIPDDLPTIRYWDLAASNNKGSDYSIGLKGAYDGENIYIIDMFKKQYTPNKLLSAFNRTIRKDGKKVRQFIEEEPGSSGKIAIQQIKSNFPNYYIRGDRPKDNKFIRSFNAQSLAEDGRIYLLKSGWNDDFINDCVAFTGKNSSATYHDDVVDCLSGIVNKFTNRKRKIYI